MRILMVGDIVGSPGRTVFARVVAALRAAGKVDFVIANAENAAAGRGITPTLANELLGAGADVLTLGDHAWDQKELAGWIGRERRVLRPANFAPGCPGAGVVTLDGPEGGVSVINLVGRVFMSATECPFRTADSILRPVSQLGRMVLVDFHAEATSEKKALGRYLDGRVTAVVGTHTHVQTSDEGLLPNGTAYITDLGMTGPQDSIIGRTTESILPRFLTGMPAKYDIASGNPLLEGVLIEVDEKTGRAKKIRRLREQG